MPRGREGCKLDARAAPGARSPPRAFLRRGNDAPHRSGSHRPPLRGSSPSPPLPLTLTTRAPTLLIRRDAFERAGLTRAALDRWLNLTDEEFRVEGPLVAVGPLYGDDALPALIEELERRDLVYYDDFFEL